MKSNWDKQWKKIEKEFDDSDQCWEDFFKEKIEELLDQQKKEIQEDIQSVINFLEADGDNEKSVKIANFVKKYLKK